MNKGTIEGKKPLNKKRPGPDFDDEIFGRNDMDIPVKLAKKLTEIGYSYRYISAKGLQDSGGYHKNAWKPLRRQDFQENGRDILEDVLWGSHPDGTIRRKEMVLAIRPIEMSARHRAEIQAKTDRQGNNVQKKAADQLRRVSESNNLGVEITEGYDENG